MIESEAVWRYDLYDYRDRRGRNDIADWTRKLQKRQRAQLNLKLDMLRKYGNDLGTNVLLRMSDTIFKLKAKTKGKQVRPMLCKGPIADDKEFTILIGAIEEDWELPPYIVETAEARRLEIIANPKDMRVPHERID